MHSSNLFRWSLHSRYSWALLCLALWSSTALAGPDAVVRTCDQPSEEWTDITFLDDDRIEGTLDGERVRQTWDNLVSVQFSGTTDRRARPVAVLFPGGEILHVDVRRADDQSLVVDHLLLGQLIIPLSAVQAIVLANQSASDQESLINEIRRLTPTGDLFVLSNGDTLSGLVTQLGPEQWVIDQNGAARSIRADVLRAVVLDPNLIEYAPPTDRHLRVRFADESELAVRRITSKEDYCELETAIGPTVRIPWGSGAGPIIESISVRFGRVRYLSDREPTRIETKPYLDDARQPKMDANVLGGPMVVAGVRYEKGIGVRSHCQLDYDATGFERFRATVGLDQWAGGLASVEFRVLVGEQVVFASGEMNRFSSPQDVDVPLPGSGTLSLVVDYARRGDLEDWADWADAQLIAPSE